MPPTELETHRAIEANMRATAAARPDAARPRLERCLYDDCKGEIRQEMIARAAFFGVVPVIGGFFCSADHRKRYDWRQTSQGLAPSELVVEEKPTAGPIPFRDIPQKGLEEREIRVKCAYCSDGDTVKQQRRTVAVPPMNAVHDWSPPVEQIARARDFTSLPGGGWVCASCARETRGPKVQQGWSTPPLGGDQAGLTAMRGAIVAAHPADALPVASSPLSWAETCRLRDAALARQAALAAAAPVAPPAAPPAEAPAAPIPPPISKSVLDAHRRATRAKPPAKGD
jgi:hypothetical protein